MIGFNAEMDNQSNRQMNGSKLRLVEHVRYMTPRKSKIETRVVAEIKRGPIGPGTSDMWEGVVMRIPAVPPTGLGGMYHSIYGNTGYGVSTLYGFSPRHNVLE